MNMQECRKVIDYIIQVDEDKLMSLKIEQKQFLNTRAMFYLKNTDQETKQLLLSQLVSKLGILNDNIMHPEPSKGNIGGPTNARKLVKTDGTGIKYGEYYSDYTNTESAFITTGSLFSAIILSGIFVWFGMIIQILIIGG